jgi:hypothetical protein
MVKITKCREERLKKTFEAAPALNRVPVQWLTDLSGAGRCDRPDGFVEAQAGLSPRQTAIREQPSGLVFEVVNQIFVADVEYDVFWKSRAPLSHESAVGSIVTSQFGRS